MNQVKTNYEKLYQCEGYYWGTEPAELCYEIEKIKPQGKGTKVLDIGCGEGKDAVYFAKQGYDVSGFDITESGIAKSKALAKQEGVSMNAFVADINDMNIDDSFDIIYSTGTIQYLDDDKKDLFFEKAKAMTNADGIHWFNVFVENPDLPLPPDWDETEKMWQPGELVSHYTDWKILKNEQIIFDCNSSGIPHKHCMEIVIAGKAK